MMPSIVPVSSTQPAIATSTTQYKGLQSFFSRVITWCLHGLAWLLPLFFTTWTLDAVELNKQTLLMLVASVAGIAWLGKALAEKQFSLGRNWVHGVVVLFGLGYLLISLLSQDRYQSMIGLLGQMGWSFATIVSLIVLYFVAVNHLQRTEQVYNLVCSFFGSSTILAFVGLFQIFGVYLFVADATRTSAFTPVGSVFALATYLVVPLVMAASLAFHGCRNHVCYLGSKEVLGKVARGLVWATIAACLAFLLVVDFWVAWVGLLFGTLLTVGIGYARTRSIGKLTQLMIPGLLVVASVLMLIIPSPFFSRIPAEVSPSASASWSIARSVLQERPFFGTGPGTWMNNYSLYRPAGVNLSPFWSMRFDRGFSAFLTMLATIGMAGTALWLILVGSVATKSSLHLMQERNEDVWFAYLTLFTGWMTSVCISFFYSVNMAHQFVFWFLLAMLGALLTKNDFHWNARSHAKTFILLSGVFILGLVGSACFAWMAGQRYVAEWKFTRGVEGFRTNKPLTEVIPLVKSAVALNPWNDLYVRNLSQAYLLQSVQSIQQKPTPEQFNKIQAEQVAPTVEMANKATKLAPHSVDNWSSLAVVYQTLSAYMQDAGPLAIKSYQEAMLRESTNPAYPTEIGHLFLNQADAYKPLLDSKDKAQQTQAKQAIQQSLMAAQESLQKAVTLKSDYFPAHYYLGVVMERQNKLKEAIAELEQVLRSNNKEMGVAFELSILYYRSGQKDRATNLLEQIVRLDPSRVNARWYLASLYEEAKRTQDAINQLEMLVKQVPDNQAIQQRLTALKQQNGGQNGQPLPEPLPERVTSPSEQNPVRP